MKNFNKRKQLQMPGAGMITIIMLCMSFYLHGQSVPQKMNYQAVLRDANSQLLINQAVGIKISIIQNSATGNVVYSEVQAATTNNLGLVQLEIGGGTPVAGNFSAIDWSSGPYFVKIEVDPAGGTAYVEMGTSQLLSVPYALYAENSGGTGSNIIAGAGLTLSGNVLDAIHQSPMWNANALMSVSLSPVFPVINDVLRFNGSTWIPSAISGGGGTTIDCSTTSNSNYTVRGTGSGNWACTNAMVITSSGYVGIGTTSPSSSYDLTIGTSGFLVNGSTTTSNISGRLRIGSTSSTSYDLQVDGQTYITSGLRVGTTSSPPSSGIRANGDIQTGSRFIQGSSTTGSGTVVVRTSSGELRPQSSTIKVKDNVQNLIINKDKILSLRPVSYELKPALGGGHEIGLIAEEVELLVPDLVVYGPSRKWIDDTGLVETDGNGNEILDYSTSEPYSVHYDRLSVYLLEIIKEQEERISVLEEKLELMMQNNSIVKQ